MAITASGSSIFTFTDKLVKVFLAETLLEKTADFCVNIFFRKSCPYSMAERKSLGYICGSRCSIHDSWRACLSTRFGDLFDFSFCLLTCVGMWLLFGSFLKKFLMDETKRRIFNYCMSAFLVLAVMPVLIKLIETL